MKHKYLLIIITTLLCLGGCKDENKSPIDNNGDDTSPDLSPITDKVQTFITTADGTMRLSVVTKDYGEGINMSPERTLTLVPTKRYQQYDGFGAAISGATAYNLMHMPVEARTKLLEETFNPQTGLGFNYMRVPIGGCDFNAEGKYDYSCCDTKGIENFALPNAEKNYIIPVLKEILAINPAVKIMGTPWSCPKWMKVEDITTKVPHDSWIGGHLNPDYYQDYATYFVKWIQAFESEGIKITSVTVENEPLNYTGNSMSLAFPWVEERDFIKTALGPAFKKAGLTTKIICYDHNYNYDNKSDQTKYPLHIYADQEASQYVDGAAYHNYGGTWTELDAIHKSAPEKNLYFTEASIGDWNNGGDLSVSLLSETRYTFFEPASRWCKAVIVWNFMLDDKRGPHGGAGACNTCFGAVDVSSKDYTTLTKRSHYYAIGHFSKVIKTDATRIGTTGYTPTNTYVLAAENTDNNYGVVLINEGTESQKMIVEVSEKWVELMLPPKSVTSCIIK